MTWIIGQAQIFGYAVGISDIRVTLPDKTERDCLQKIYPVGPMIALGFAGSVAIGFAMVRRLSELLHVDRPDVHWDPTEVARWWPEDARQVFGGFDDPEKASRCHLLMLATHPTEDAGEAPWPKCYVYRFLSPDFEPVGARGAQIVSVGSGSSVDAYVAELRRIEGSFSVLQMEAGDPGGAGFHLMTSLTRVIERSPSPGVSRYLHMLLVRRSGIELSTYDRHAPTRPDLDLKMPAVARSLEELSTMLQDAGLSAAHAVC